MLSTFSKKMRHLHPKYRLIDEYFARGDIQKLMTHTVSFLDEIIHKSVDDPFQVTKNFFTTFEPFTVRYYFLEEYRQFCLKISDRTQLSSSHLLWIAYDFDRNEFIRTNNEVCVEQNGKVYYAKYNDDQLVRDLFVKIKQLANIYYREYSGEKIELNIGEEIALVTFESPNENLYFSKKTTSLHTFFEQHQETLGEDLTTICFELIKDIERVLPQYMASTNVLKKYELKRLLDEDLYALMDAYISLSEHNRIQEKEAMKELISLIQREIVEVREAKNSFLFYKTIEVLKKRYQ